MGVAGVPPRNPVVSPSATQTDLPSRNATTSAWNGPSEEKRPSPTAAGTPLTRWTCPPPGPPGRRAAARQRRGQVRTVGRARCSPGVLLACPTMTARTLSSPRESWLSMVVDPTPPGRRPARSRDRGPPSVSGKARDLRVPRSWRHRPDRAGRPPERGFVQSERPGDRLTAGIDGQHRLPIEQGLQQLERGSGHRPFELSRPLLVSGACPIHRTAQAETALSTRATLLRSASLAASSASRCPSA